MASLQIYSVVFTAEGEAEFEETLSLMKEVKFDSAFLFKYSG